MRVSAVAFVSLVSSSPGCTGADADRTALQLEVVVESDPGRPISGVPVYVDGEKLGLSGADGSIRSALVERPGARVRASCRCPSGYEPEEPSQSFLVRRYSARENVPEVRIDLRCRPSVRLAVFVVRVADSPNVDVFLSGQYVASTGSNGVAHFSTHASPGTEHRVDLLVDPGSALLPRAHTFFFVMPDTEELFVMNPSFEPDRSMRTPIRRRRRITRIE